MLRIRRSRGSHLKNGRAFLTGGLRESEAEPTKALEADIFIPGHGPIPEDPKQTRAALDRAQQILVDARDGIQNEIARGATEDQAVAAVKLQQYEKLPSFTGQREVVLRRIYRELKGTLQ